MTSDEFDILDVPGAAEVSAAGEVAAPTPAVLREALRAVRAAAAVEHGRRDGARQDDNEGQKTGDGPKAGEEPKTGDGPKAGDPQEAGAAVPLRPGRGRRRLLVSAVAVAAAVAGAVIYPTISVDGGKPAASANAADFLHAVAHTAAQQEPTAEAPYWKVRSQNVMWLPPELKKTPARKITSGGTIWLSRAGMIQSNGRGDVVDFRTMDGKQHMSWDVAGHAITWDDVKTLPTEPDALRTRLLGASADPADGEALFNGVDALLSRAPSSPALRAALFDILGDIPGVRMVGQVKDGTGRGGTAVEIDVQDSTTRLVIDPDTAQLLESGVSRREGGKERPVNLITYLSEEPAWSAPRPTESIGDPRAARGGRKVPEMTAAPRHARPQ